MTRSWDARRRPALLPAILVAAGVAAAVGALAPRPVLAESARSQNEAGNALYREGRFAEARDRYLAAQSDQPEAPELDFNIGSSFYQEGRFLDALGSFTKATSRWDGAKRRKPLSTAAAAYNAGNALFKAGKTAEAIEFYKKALRANPADADAKHNLEFAQKKKEEEKKQQEEKEKQQKEQQKEQQPRQQQKNKGQDDKKKQDEKPEDSGQKPEEHEQQQQEQQQKESEKERPDSLAARQPESQPGGEVRGMPKEDALRILEALEAQELAQARQEEMKALQRALSSEGKDW